jgi:hypothetical protein
MNAEGKTKELRPNARLFKATGPEHIMSNTSSCWMKVQTVPSWVLVTQRKP